MKLKKLIYNIKFYLIKIIFIDKYIMKKFTRNDTGVIKIKNKYFVDIPKVGSSSIKYLIAKKSKRFIFLNLIFNNVPIHPAVTPVQRLKHINNEKKLFLFIKSPEERLFSVYKEKILFNKTIFNFSIIKGNKFKFFKKNKKCLYRFNNNDSFYSFCNGIIKLNEYFNEIEIEKNIFDKHIISQFDHIVNLKKNYPNINEFKIVIYPICKMNDILGNLHDKKTKLNFNTTQKTNNDYKKDIEKTNIINIFYRKDKILYEQLLSSDNGFIELSYESILKKII